MTIAGADLLWQSRIRICHIDMQISNLVVSGKCKINEEAQSHFKRPIIVTDNLSPICH